MPLPTQINYDFPPFFRVHSDGSVERYIQHDFAPASHDSKNGIVSKDVFISPESNVSARLYLPKTAENGRKMQLIVYVHGGAFSVESAFSSLYYSYVNSLAADSKSVVVSVEYRLAPEYPTPACYDDCYAALKWVDLHSGDGNGPDPWLNEYADFERVYMAGDSAGANIAHNMGIRANTTTADDGLGYKFAGLVLVDPFFGIGQLDELRDFICPGTSAANDVRLNPMANMDLLSKLGCERVLVCVAEKDALRDGLKKSGWKGVAEFLEAPGEYHVFHTTPGTDNAVSLMKRIVGVINSGHQSMSGM